MKLKVVLLCLLVASGIYLFWNKTIQPLILTDLHDGELKTALVKYWNVILDKSILADPSKIATVATGEALQDRVSSLPFLAATKYTDYLKSAEVTRVLEYTPTCSHVEARVEHAPGFFRYHYFFVREDGDWKVAYQYQILPKPDFEPPDEPQKSCADFVK